jgi:hypothetical protein
MARLTDGKPRLSTGAPALVNWGNGLNGWFCIYAVCRKRSLGFRWPYLALEMYFYPICGLSRKAKPGKKMPYSYFSRTKRFIYPIKTSPE